MGIKIVSMVVVMSLSALSVGAETPQGTGKQEPVPGATFKRLDSNGDGKLTFSEAQADPEVISQFTAYDMNNDGVLTPAEIDAKSRGKKKY